MEKSYIIQYLSKKVNEGKRLFFEYMDLSDSYSINQLIRKIKPDYLFHLAAQSSFTSFQMPDITYDVNINGTHRLLNSIKDCGINPLIHICSSSEVFEELAKIFTN